MNGEENKSEKLAFLIVDVLLDSSMGDASFLVGPGYF
jgi:hypothetical protein